MMLENPRSSQMCLKNKSFKYLTDSESMMLSCSVTNPRKPFFLSFLFYLPLVYPGRTRRWGWGFGNMIQGHVKLIYTNLQKQKTVTECGHVSQQLCQTHPMSFLLRICTLLAFISLLLYIKHEIYSRPVCTLYTLVTNHIENRFRPRICLSLVLCLWTRLNLSRPWVLHEVYMWDQVPLKFPYSYQIQRSNFTYTL